MEDRLRAEVGICKQEVEFIPEKGPKDVLFPLRIFMRKFSEEQRELHSVFNNLTE